LHHQEQGLCIDKSVELIKRLGVKYLRAHRSSMALVRMIAHITTNDFVMDNIWSACRPWITRKGFWNLTLRDGMSKSFLILFSPSLIQLTNAQSYRNTRYNRYHGNDERPCKSWGAAKDFCRIVREAIQNNPTKDNPSATYYPTKKGVTTGHCITLDLVVKRLLVSS
jgi:hypothetical protein